MKKLVHLPTFDSPFWQTLWLAAALVLCKATLLGLPTDWSIGGLLDYSRDLGVMSHADVLFASLIGFVASVSLRLTNRSPFGRAVLQALLQIVCLVSLAYGIVSVQVFAYLRSHLTYPLIYLAGDMKNMRSSLGAFVSPILLAALLLGPASYIFLVRITSSLGPLSRGWRLRLTQAVGLAALLLYVAIAHRTYGSLPWADRVDRRVAENPHWVLISSLATDLLSAGRTARLDTVFPPEHVADFRVLAERQAKSIPMALTATVEFGQPVASAGLEPAIRDSVGETDEIQLLRACADRKPIKNVIVYVLESVGTQQLSLYGGRYETTPCLQRESTNALVFDNFYAHCGVTANSLVAINLGIYPGLTWREYTVEQPRLPGTTLAELLHARGYRTAYMTSGEIQYVNMDGFLKQRGYDLVCGYERLGCHELIMSWGVEDRCLVDSLLQWIDQDTAGASPFYAMIWTQQTHHPYEPSPGVPFTDFFKGLNRPELPPDDYDLGRYLNVVREADRQLGRLFEGLRRRGLADDTLVVVTGDHGEGFGWPHDIYGHGGRLFDEIVKVPLVLWNPRLFRAGHRVPTIGGHIDLNPTLAAWLGVAPAGSWQGRSLFDTDRPPRTYFYAANDDYLLGVREGTWKYIYNATIAREQLYDLASDSQEQINLAIDEPERCLNLRQRLAAWMKYEQGHIASLRGGSR